MEEKRYPKLDEEESVGMVSEPALATADRAVEMPDDIAYVEINDGVLMISPDIEEEIAEVDRGETVSMSEFNTMFAKWLD